MTRTRIQRFFATLARELGAPARVYVTGAAAAALWGSARPSVDIDFGLELRTKSAGWWQKAEAAVTRTAQLTGIAASAAEDIDRWGMITLLDYRRTSRLYERVGRLEIRLLDPTRWAIGKLTRYLDSDLRDVSAVFKKKQVTAATAARTWGTALRASPPSTSQLAFRRNVEHFFAEQGPRVWGRSFDPTRAIRLFHRSARITTS